MTRQDLVRFSDIFKVVIVPLSFMVFGGVTSYYVKSIDARLEKYGEQIQKIEVALAVAKAQLEGHMENAKKQAD